MDHRLNHFGLDDLEDNSRCPVSEVCGGSQQGPGTTKRKIAKQQSNVEAFAKLNWSIVEACAKLNGSIFEAFAKLNLSIVEAFVKLKFHRWRCFLPSISLLSLVLFSFFFETSQGLVWQLFAYVEDQKKDRQMGLPFGAYEWQGALMLVLAVKAGKTGSSEKAI